MSRLSGHIYQPLFYRVMILLAFLAAGLSLAADARWGLPAGRHHRLDRSWSGRYGASPTSLPVAGRRKMAVDVECLVRSSDFRDLMV